MSNVQTRNMSSHMFSVEKTSDEHNLQQNRTKKPYRTTPTLIKADKKWQIITVSSSFPTSVATIEIARYFI